MDHLIQLKLTYLFLKIKNGVSRLIFLKQIAQRLQINPHNLSIKNFYFGSKYDDQKKIMCCPAEYIEAKDKIFNVNIV